MQTIICDTRQKNKHHLNKEMQFIEMGYKLINSKLPIGDYAFLTDLSRVVDTKKNLDEVASNITGGKLEHERFRRECILAQENGMQLIILVENCKGITTVADVAKWQNPRFIKWCKVRSAQKNGKMMYIKQSKRPPANGEQLAKAMQTIADKYGVQWEFCPDDKSGVKVVELLKG